MPSPTHAGECKLACVERAAGLASVGDQQRNIDMTMQGAFLTQTAGATEDALIGLMQRQKRGRRCRGNRKCFTEIDSLSVCSTGCVGLVKVYHLDPVACKSLAQRQDRIYHLNLSLQILKWEAETWLATLQDYYSCISKRTEQKDSAMIGDSARENINNLRMSPLSGCAMLWCAVFLSLHHASKLAGINILLIKECKIYGVLSVSSIKMRLTNTSL